MNKKLDKKFIAIASLIIVLLLFLIVYSINFVKNGFESVFSSESKKPVVKIKFNFEKLKEIGIIPKEE